MTRRITSADEMFDILGSMGGGKFVTICHINYAHLNLPDERKSGIFNFIFNRKEKGSFQKFGKRFGLDNLSNIITVTRYRQLNWLPHNQLAKKYGEFRQAANKIRTDFGINAARKKNPVYKTMRYGGGIRVGNTPNTRGKAYVDQNTFSANRDISYYGVDSQGNIIREFSKKELVKYLNYTRDIDGLNQLKRLTNDNNKINQYIRKILDLKMEYTTFFNDRIMYMIGSTQQGKFFFINDHLANEVEGITINPQELTKITREKYSQDCQIMNEIKHKQNIITENKAMKLFENSNGISIQTLSMQDINYVAEYIQQTFCPEDSIEELIGTLNDSSINFQYSTKAINKNGEIIGICLLSNETLDDETDGEFSQVYPEFNEELNKYSYLTMFMIGINREYSRQGLLNHSQLLSTSMSYIKGFDFLVVPIMNELKTHKLWGRYGTIQIFKNSEETLYAIPNNEEIKKVINNFNESIKENMKKNTVRLTEAQLHKVIKESVKRVLKENKLGSDLMYLEDLIKHTKDPQKRKKLTDIYNEMWQEWVNETGYKG